jgi:hypothetical protein
MDRLTLSSQLAQAHEHVASGERAIRRQRHQVSTLVRAGDGEDAAQAKRWLAQVEYMQALHLEDLARLQDELSADP